MSVALNWILSTAWAIDKEKLEVIYRAVDRQVDVEALEAKLGKPLENSYAVTVRDGIATIPVHGVISKRASMFSRISGGVSTDLLARDFRQALDDPKIRAIILDIDSPGGEVTGVNELSKMIYEARGKKPIVAYGTGAVASGAYWLASAADRLVVDDVSALGSIGVILTLSRQDEGSVNIISSQSPKKRLNPDNKKDRDELQALADSMAEVFVQRVALHRGVDAETVVTKFGEGGLLIGQQAIDAGMADSIGTYESLVSELSKPGSPVKTKEGVKSMNEQELTQQVSSLTAELAVARAKAELNDAEKAIYHSMSATQQSAFVAASPAERSAMLEKIEAQNPVVYAAKDGTVYRKNDDPRFVQSAKRADELDARLEQAQKAEAQAKVEAFVSAEMKNFKGDSATLTLIATAVHSIEDEALRSKALESIRATNAAASVIFEEKGTRSAPNAEGDDLDKMVKAYMTEHKVSEAVAYDAVLKTEAGRKAYEMHG